MANKGFVKYNNQQREFWNDYFKQIFRDYWRMTVIGGIDAKTANIICQEYFEISFASVNRAIELGILNKWYLYI